MGLRLFGVDKTKQTEQQYHGKWSIFVDRKIFYEAPAIEKKSLCPREGRWEIARGGEFPAPTVNRQRLPDPFLLTGWDKHNGRLNGEYLPLDNGTKLLNGRPIFKHTPVVNNWAHNDSCRMYWSHGAWRIGDRDRVERYLQQKRPEQKQCMGFVESDAMHPTAIPAEVEWNGTTSGCDIGKHENDFESVEGVRVTTGTVCVHHLFQLRCGRSVWMG